MKSTKTAVAEEINVRITPSIKDIENAWGDLNTKNPIYIKISTGTAKIRDKKIPNNFRMLITILLS
ncbi:hypothetical protein [Acidianus brierleyi]|uniref:hypothetical protein n=1 Tax=Acidianus brierleyi TaxID=41673 RepID=UPI001FE357BD|nr:hypothetical protein [Acidianus brierleyi]